MSATPPLGPVSDGIESAMNATCSYATGFGAALCGAPASFHIIWDMQAENSLACADHAEEARSLWCPRQVHERGPDCAMPGSVFIEPERRCVTEGIEAAPELVAVSVADSDAPSCPGGPMDGSGRCDLCGEKHWRPAACHQPSQEAE